MTSFGKFQPALLYKRPFDEEGSERRVYSKKKYQCIRMCKGTSTEELLYTIRLFENAAEQMSLKEEEKVNSLLTLFGPTMMTKYQKVLKKRTDDKEDNVKAGVFIDIKDGEEMITA